MQFLAPGPVRCHGARPSWLWVWHYIAQLGHCEERFISRPRLAPPRPTPPPTLTSERRPFDTSRPALCLPTDSDALSGVGLPQSHTQVCVQVALQLYISEYIKIQLSHKEQLRYLFISIGLEYSRNQERLGYLPEPGSRVLLSGQQRSD